jgi:hypothetical protein
MNRVATPGIEDEVVRTDTEAGELVVEHDRRARCERPSELDLKSLRVLRPDLSVELVGRDAQPDATSVITVEMLFRHWLMMPRSPSSASPIGLVASR